MNGPTRQRIELVFLLFFVSGFGGLIYESVWSHYVKLFLGHAAYAQTLVLVVFIGGLAVGSWLTSRYATRFSNPLRAYAWVEAVTGLLALAFHSVFVSATQWAYAWLLPATCDPANTVCVSQWLLSALLLAPQSVLLGATFPLVSSAVLRWSSEQAGHDISTLYFLNSLGATMGVLAAGFLLIPSIGLPGTLHTAAFANLAVAVGAFLLSRRPPPPLVVPPRAAEGVAQAGGDRRFVRLMLAVAALTGLSSFIYEISWIRMLAAVLGASTYSFELMLASFILGLAIGGWRIRRRIDSTGDTVRLLAIVQVVMGVAAAATLPLYAVSFDFMAWLISSVARNEGGFVLFNLTSTTICLLVMLPATICAGMTLPLITYRLLRSPEGERSLGRVYAVNTLGSILGVVIAVHLLMPLVGVKATLIVGCAIDVALGLGLLILASPRGSWRARWPAFAGVVAVVFFAVAVDNDPRRSASGVFRTGAARIGDSNSVIYHRDGKTATVDVIESDQNRSIRTNGKPDAALTMKPGFPPTGDEYTMTLLAVLPMGHVQAKTAAVIGFGSGLSTSVLLTSPYMKRVDTVEIEPSMVEGARAFRPLNAAAYDDPRSRIIYDDAKSYFARGHNRYDIIVSEPSNPWVSGVSSLFTEEFYARISQYLNEGGVFSQWLHTYEIDAETLASIVRAVSRTFPDYLVYTTIDADVVLIARKDGPTGRFDPAVLKYPGLQPVLTRLRLTDPQSIAHRAVARAALITPFFTTYGSPVNSDYFPFVDYRTGKSRFTRPRVLELSDLQTSAVPLLEMLDGSYRPMTKRVSIYANTDAEHGAEQAFLLRDVLMATGPSRGLTPMLDMGEVAATMTREWAADCRHGPTFVQVLPAMIDVARVLTPHLDASLAAEAWKPVVSSPCAASIEPVDRAWLDLIGAVARRDAATMRTSGLGALSTYRGVPSAMSEYAFLASATAMVCRNELEQARVFIRDQRLPYVRPDRLQSEIRLLRALAWSDTPLQTSCSAGRAATSGARDSR